MLRKTQACTPPPIPPMSRRTSTCEAGEDDTAPSPPLRWPGQDPPPVSWSPDMQRKPPPAAESRALKANWLTIISGVIMLVVMYEVISLRRELRDAVSPLQAELLKVGPAPASECASSTEIIDLLQTSATDCAGEVLALNMNGTAELWCMVLLRLTLPRGAAGQSQGTADNVVLELKTQYSELQTRLENLPEQATVFRPYILLLYVLLCIELLLSEQQMSRSASS
eukprot:4322704-Pleurochrysis_carterae.AAC.3